MPDQPANEPEQGQVIVETRELTKFYGGVGALQGANLTVRHGEILCLAGENGCGKSTLMKAIAGSVRPTSGEILVDGTSYPALTPRQSRSLGLELIYQDFSLLPNLTAAENIALPSMVGSGRVRYSRAAALEMAEQAVQKLGTRLDLNTPVGELTVADRQMTAIARSLAGNVRLIAMDEPTTALTWKEVDGLFATVQRLREHGTAIVFISHKMQEVFRLADRVSIMRNGVVLDTMRPAELTPKTLTERMTGREAVDLRRSAATGQQRPALSVSGLGRSATFADISFTVGRGEIVGLSGLLGSGRTEIAESIAGLAPPDEGTVRVDDVPVNLTSVRDAMAAGIGYVPEDRLTQGLFLDQPIGDNLVAATVDRHRSKAGLLDWRGLRATMERIVADLRIKIGDLDDPVRSLSGGNAQRVLLGKWLLTEPKVLILNGPTVGVDVGSKFDILSFLHTQSVKGLGVLIISDDVPELVATCHRVLVVRGGRLVSEIAGDQLTEANVMKAVAA